MDEKSYVPLDSKTIEKELGRVKYNQEFSHSIRNTVFVLIMLVAVAILLAILFLPILQIYGTSMSPAVAEDSFVLAVKTNNPKRGDILAFDYNNKIVLRRVIGIPGDKIEIDAAGNIKVNDEFFDDSEYNITNRSLGNCDLEFPYTVPEGQYFVMADQRDQVDSRNSAMGCISKEVFEGVVKFTVWPLNKMGFTK